MAPLFLIPVRGGSKGVPRKNLRTVGGISLLGRAVRRAQEAARLLGGGRVVVDSDDEALLAEGRRWGAETPYLRPAALASDTAASLDVVRHALARLPDGDPLVLCQATSPLVPAAHVADAVRASAGGAPAVSVTRAAHPPAWCYQLDDAGALLPLLPEHAAARRQDLPAAFRLSGAVYVSARADLLAGRPFVQPGRTRGVVLAPHLAIDVDSEDDLRAADALTHAPPAAVRVGDRAIGPGQPCFVIAEAGVNHDGDLAEAHRLVDAAADSGADAVKFQTWQTALLCRPGTRKASYQVAQDGAAGDQFTMLERLALPYPAFAELAAHARARGLVFLSTPFDHPSARFLVDELGVAAIKIGSGELDNLPFLAQLARCGRPLLLSTGTGDLVEVAAALDCVRAHGDPPVALFHAVTAYPAPLAAMNVRVIATLRAAFGVPVGLSDHCPGPEAMLAAVGQGLPIWEKHLTRDRARAGPDHAASCDPDELGRQIQLLRRAELALGDGDKRLQDCEAGNRAVVRRRLHAARAVAAGAPLGADDLVGLRAETGISTARWAGVLGRITRRALAAGDALHEEDLAPLAGG